MEHRKAGVSVGGFLGGGETRSSRLPTSTTLSVVSKDEDRRVGRCPFSYAPHHLAPSHRSNHIGHVLFHRRVPHRYTSLEVLLELIESRVAVLGHLYATGAYRDHIKGDFTVPKQRLVSSDRKTYTILWKEVRPDPHDLSYNQEGMK